MQVTLADQILADWPGNPAEYTSSEDFDGQVLVENEPITRGSRFLEARQNEQITFSFIVTRQFANLALAEAFFLTYWSGLTKQGALTINAGYAADDPGLVVITAANAILERMRILDPIGASMRVQFYILTTALAAA